MSDKSSTKELDKEPSKELSSNYDQSNIYKFDKINFKDVDVNVYTLKINSKSRNISKEPNPFNFELGFHQDSDSLKEKRAIIPAKFENIKKIQVSQILIPRFIPRDFMGEPFNGITPLYDSSNTITLSYYPGININNTITTIVNNAGVESKIEVIELVDLNNRKINLVALEYNNPYYLKYINIKSDIYSYLNINDNIYPITKIIGSLIQVSNTDLYPLPSYTSNRLTIGDFYKNIIKVDLQNENNVYFNINTIFIHKVNPLNFQYIYPKQYLEFQINSSLSDIEERKLFKIESIKFEKIENDLEVSISNTKVVILGEWTDGFPTIYSNTNPFSFAYNQIIKISQFNFGVRDLLDEKIFYFNISPFTPSKFVSTEPEVNDSFGVFFPSTQSKDYLYLRGEAFEVYNSTNLQTTNNKFKFSLLDSNYEQVGTIYNKYFNLYQPLTLPSVKSYLPNIPDITIVMKIEEIVRKNIVPSDTSV